MRNCTKRCTGDPELISLAQSAEGLAVGASLVRFLRVLRVFRIFRLGKRIKSEVNNRLLTLIITLLSIIVTAAGLFYEIETKWGVSTSLSVCKSTGHGWHITACCLLTAEAGKLHAASCCCCVHVSGTCKQSAYLNLKQRTQACSHLCAWPRDLLQDRYEDLTYIDAIYWSVVTVTTIGYGDFSPSVVASQVTLLGMLVVSFTILPYQTSMLLSAMTATSVYQRCQYSQGARGRHVIVTGHFDHLSAGLIVEQLYHADYGKIITI